MQNAFIATFISIIFKGCRLHVCLLLYALGLRNGIQMCREHVNLSLALHIRSVVVQLAQRLVYLHPLTLLISSSFYEANLD